MVRQIRGQTPKCTGTGPEMYVKEKELDGQTDPGTGPEMYGDRPRNVLRAFKSEGKIF